MNVIGQPKAVGPLSAYETMGPPIQPSAFKVATFKLTDAQIKTLVTVPVTLVSAPGSNRGLVPVFAVLNSHIVTPYAGFDLSAGAAALQIWNGAGGGFELTPLPAVSGKLQDIFTGDHNIVMPIAAANDAFWGLIPYNTSTPSGNNNQPIITQLGNGANGNLTGGNAANSLSITLCWIETDLS